jgi:hypothetical protein
MNKNMKVTIIIGGSILFIAVLTLVYILLSPSYSMESFRNQKPTVIINTEPFLSNPQISLGSNLNIERSTIQMDTPSSKIPTRVVSLYPLGDSVTNNKSWCNLNLGMTVDEIVSEINTNHQAKIEILHRNKVNLDFISDPFYYVDQYIEVTCGQENLALLSISKGEVVVIRVLKNQYSVNILLAYFGSPEMYKAYYVKAENNIQTSISYHFLYPLTGVVFGGQIIVNRELEKKVKPEYPVEYIYLVKPENYHYLFESYFPSLLDPNNLNLLEKNWMGVENMRIE